MIDNFEKLEEQIRKAISEKRSTPDSNPANGIIKDFDKRYETAIIDFMKMYHKEVVLPMIQSLREENPGDN